MKTEPALILGAVFAGLYALSTLILGGGLDDGLQTYEAVGVLAPVGAAFGIRIRVDSPATVEQKVAKARRVR